MTKKKIDEIIITINDINSYEDACIILGEDILDFKSTIINSNNKVYTLDNQEIALLQLKTIIKAVNFIDNNNKLWKGEGIHYYFPWLRKNEKGIWNFIDAVFVSSCSSGNPYGLHYKSDYSCKIITKRFINLYRLMQH